MHDTTPAPFRTIHHGIHAWGLGNGLTLVCDENNPDGGPDAWAIIEGDLPTVKGCEAFWRAAEDSIVPTDPRVLGALARALGRDVTF